MLPPQGPTLTCMQPYRPPGVISPTRRWTVAPTGASKLLASCLSWPAVPEIQMHAWLHCQYHHHGRAFGPTKPPRFNLYGTSQSGCQSSPHALVIWQHAHPNQRHCTLCSWATSLSLGSVSILRPLKGGVAQRL